MIRDLADRFDPEHLQLFLFGPSPGESLVFYVPPGVWGIVDSCRGRKAQSSIVPALDLLKAADARADVIIFTHPHEDHAEGMDLLIDAFPSATIGAVGCFHDDLTQVIDSANSERARRIGVKRRALVATQRAWADNAGERKWDLRAGDERVFGDGTLEILWPRQSDVDAFEPSQNPNSVSAACWLRWNDFRALLAADLPAPHWEHAAEQASEDICAHTALKVSHHGSKQAQQKEALEPRGSSLRQWCVTPWRRGGRFLPDYGESGGVAELHRFESRVGVTSLGVESSLGTIGGAWTRSEISEAVAEVAHIPMAGGAPALLSREVDVREAWIAAAFDGQGQLVDYDRGQEALTVSV